MWPFFLEVCCFVTILFGKYCHMSPLSYFDYLFVTNILGNLWYVTTFLGKQLFCNRFSWIYAKLYLIFLERIFFVTSFLGKLKYYSYILWILYFCDHYPWNISYLWPVFLELLHLWPYSLEKEILLFNFLGRFYFCDHNSWVAFLFISKILGILHFVTSFFGNHIVW